MLQDLRFAARMLVKNPGFSAVAMLSLALGIGANSAIFSLADGLLLRPLPVARPGEVVTVQYKSANNPYEGVSYRDYVDYRDRNRSFDSLVAFEIFSAGFAQTPGALPQVKMGLLVTGNFFQAMGVEPSLGRAFRPEEDQVAGRDAVAVLSFDMWQKQFGGDPNIVGKHMRLNGVEFTIVGVAPERFTGMDQYFRSALYVPVHMWPRLSGTTNGNSLEDRSHRSLSVKGRVKSGISLRAAEADLAGIAKGLEQSYPATNRDRVMAVRTELQARIERSPPDAALVAMLMTIVGIVLLIACANAANLLLSRARGRAREIAVRLAVGASRARLIRQMLTESLLLALAGGALGLLLGKAGVTFFSQIQLPTDMPVAVGVQLDERVLMFSFLVSVASVLLFGLAPALQTTKADLVANLKEGARGTDDRRRLIGRNVLVVGQVALSLTLLSASVMLLRGFKVMLGEDPGFRHDHLMMMSFDPKSARYTPAQTLEFYRVLRERAQALPGVKSAALASGVPFGFTQNSATIYPEGYSFPAGKEGGLSMSTTVTPRYFETMGVSLVSGREFSENDGRDSPRVAIINEVLAKDYWPKQDPLGRRFRLNEPGSEWVQIVGVAKTGKYIWIAEPPTAHVYVPLAQREQSRMTLLTESFGDPAGLSAPLRELVRTIDANQPVYDLRTMEDLYRMRAVKTPGMIMETVASMGLMGLALALVGLYGLIAYSVSRRTREIGIRMAVGAGRIDVLRMVLKQGLGVTAVGIGFGLVLSFGAARVLDAMFSTSGPPDPVAFLVLPAALLAITMLAAYLPARRASRVDPTIALRYE